MHAALLAIAAKVVFTHVTCTGAEPFWSAEVKNGKITFARPEDKAPTTIAVKSSDPIQGPAADAFGRAVRGDGATLFVFRGDCSDGMHEQKTDYSCLLDWHGAAWFGCGKLGK
jgi:uncharacterized membrane protein